MFRLYLQLAALAVLSKGYTVMYCKVDPVRCHEQYHDYTWWAYYNKTNVTTANISLDVTTYQVRRPILSAQDLMFSCDSIILVLCLHGYDSRQIGQICNGC